MYPYQIFNLKF